MSSLAMVEQALRYVIEDGGTENHLQSLTLQEGPRHPEWDNPWGAVNKRSSRVFQATRTTNAGEDEQNINRRQIEGPLKTELEQRFRKKEPEHAEKKTREYLDTMPPAVLSRMIEDNRIQTLSLSSGIEDSTYESRTSGWDAKLAEYEERWRKSSGILPMLEWQLQKRKRQGWKLWDMPLMQSDAGSEGFLYERMAETTLEG